jgi:hypothetical protein
MCVNFIPEKLRRLARKAVGGPQRTAQGFETADLKIAKAQLNLLQ